MRNIPRWSRQRARALIRWARKRKDAAVLMRAQVVAMAVRGAAVGVIAATIGFDRSHVYRIIRAFLQSEREALMDRRHASGMRIADDSFCGVVRTLVGANPRQYGYERATWTRELLVQVSYQLTGTKVSVRTMSRVLRRIDARRGRPKPIVAPRLSSRQQRRRLRAIRDLVDGLGPDDVVVYEDEVDIHLNPHIGWDWMLRGQQKLVLTPGNNAKAYVAGALDAHDGRLTWVGGTRKTSDLFVALLQELEHAYPHAARIYVILDNFGIHHSAQTTKVLNAMPRIRLVFLPPYSPDHNRIERRWEDLHANVTRNHCYATLDELCGAVARWLNAASGSSEEGRPTPLLPLAA